ncbi:TAXI family TRAP transporter solute-binding subunit [Aeromonas veronii]|uniref:TAXI family TRAP transporter solute-binding subunit n=1 Tax=Aeromonas veronii TaxID=654 RepID=UPI0018804654|nr:TAXI family TRAP transporter solute-binding subunit [Aeromonas veronii]MBE8734336.1 TAXI family TRAP transporter solute-binding subunit [Aeromonas veronii]MBE8740568.1 TAXI family TRAP transporter solute-binding subunit [Aeromonas veronii]MBE8743467.1 TAXI family TRAP transporter solute-binding subunit [Aeromonas veronii]MBE8766255.1 TAXI family TRAP transporter solute-binding subunit [Aeromonas veronii]MBE8839013.1 TAXI family TRAP transporter solute-binding subunit [Aeromonas veronii]
MSLRILHHLLLPLCALSALLPFGSQALTIGTGPLNGVYYPTGGAICRVLNAGHALHGDSCTVQSTRGSMANLKALDKGDVQLALVQSDVLHHALHGTGPFSGQGTNNELRSLFRLYQESLTLLAAPNSGITTLADIEGKRVYPGNKGAGEQITSQALMAAMGWQPGQFAAYELKSDSEPLEGLCDGSLDAAFVVAGHPSLAVGDLISRCKVRLIPIEGEQIDTLLKQHPYYQRSRIAANLYPGQTTAINNIGMSAELVALASLPDPIVRTVRDTLLARVKQFSRLHPALSKVTLEQLQAHTELPLHAGMSDQPPAPLPLNPEQLTAEQLTPEPLTPAPSASEAVPTTGPVSAANGTTATLEAPSDATATSSAAVTTEATEVNPLPEEALEVATELTAPTTEGESVAPSAAASTAPAPSAAVSTQLQQSASAATAPHEQAIQPASSAVSGETPPQNKTDTLPSPSTSAATQLQP